MRQVKRLYEDEIYDLNLTITRIKKLNQIETNI